MKIRLRYFSVYDEHGVDIIDKELQYWDNDAECWMSVSEYRIRYDEEGDYNIDPNAY